MRTFATLAVFVGLAAASPLAERTFGTLQGAAWPRYFGAALAASHLSNSSDPTFARLAAAEFSGATPENEMKWCVALCLHHTLALALTLGTR